MADLYRWPDWMPKPQQEQYSYEPADRRSRTDMEVGSVLRVNFDTDETTVSCSLILNDTQSAWFEVFERKMLLQGSQWFEMPLKTGGQIEWHTVRFASRPKATVYAPFHTQYTFQLDLEKREDALCPVLTEALWCISPENLCCAGENLRYAMQEVIPESICLPLINVALCAPTDEICVASENLRSATQEVLPSITLPSVWQ